MNRLLLIPCVASCLGFVVLASSGPIDPVRAAYSAVMGSDRNENSEPLMSVKQLQENLSANWNRYNVARNRFSRVYRPERYRQRMDIAIDESLPAPEGWFAGICLLGKVQPALGLESREDESLASSSNSTSGESYPFVVDRRSGNAIVFAAGKWNDFNQWAATGN